MATWIDVRAYILANYSAEDIGEGIVKVAFTIDDSRSQVVFLSRQTLNDEEWLTVESVIGSIDSINLRGALAQVENIVVGGLAKVGDLLTLKNVVALENLDINELVRPMELVTLSADNLERALTGLDAF